MQLSSGEKKTFAILAATALAFVVIVGGAVALLVRGSETSHEGYLQVAIDRELVRVEPTTWCDLMMAECRTPADGEEPDFQHAPVPIGTSVMMSVSPDIADYPWVLYTMYADADGNIIDGGPSETLYVSGETNSLVLTSSPDRVLVNIEVQPLSAVSDDDTTMVRGILALQTTPEGFEVAQLAPAGVTAGS